MLRLNIFCDRMTPSIGCGNCQYQPNSEIGTNAGLHPCRAGMKKRSSLCRLLGDFKWNLRCQMKCRRQDAGASSVCLCQFRGLNKSLIGIAIFSHQIAKPSANFTEPMFHASLLTKARPHNPQ